MPLSATPEDIKAYQKQASLAIRTANKPWHLLRFIALSTICPV